MNKTHFKFSAMILSGALLISSCGSDDEATPSNNNGPEFPTEFSEKSVEENKASLEDNGIALVNSFSSIKSTSGIKTSISFSKHLDGATLPENLGGRVSSNQGISVIHLLASFGSGKSSANKTFSEMRAAADEFASFQEEFDNAVGVYTYVKAEDTWTYNKTGNKIVFQFPSTETGTTNNAEYSIYDYAGVNLTNGLGPDDYTGDYPTSLKADLTVDGAKKMGYVFSAAYNNSGDPTKVTLAISIDQYTFAYEVINTTSEASANYSLTEGDKNLLSFGAGAKGDFSTNNVENGENIYDVATSASAYFQIMNIKFSGEVNAKAIGDALNSENTPEQIAAIYNENYKLVVFYADSKQKIADSEFYGGTKEYTEEYCWDEWNEELQEYEYTCENHSYEDEYVEIRMVFADGTKSDLSTYTDVGFNDLQKKMEDFVESFE